MRVFARARVLAHTLTPTLSRLRERERNTHAAGFVKTFADLLSQGESFMNITRDSGDIELDGPPAFTYGEKVRSRKTVRNDGTFPGKDIGDILVKKGDVGYVTSIGSFVQQFYIYGVEFVSQGYRVGMKRRELESIDMAQGGA
jgi:nitrogen fixation protein NifZ